MNYLYLNSLAMDAADVDNATYEEARRTWLCSGCVSPKPGIQVLDLVIDTGAKVSRTPLTIVNGLCVGLIRRDLMSVLGEDQFRKDFFVGTVTTNKGLSADWFTFRGKAPVHVRGHTRSPARRCTECGALLYYAVVRDGPRYLCPAPPDNRVLFESAMGLVVPDALRARIEAERFKDLDLEPLPVLIDPKDGLPIDLESAPELAVLRSLGS